MAVREAELTGGRSGTQTDNAAGDAGASIASLEGLFVAAGAEIIGQLVEDTGAANDAAVGRVVVQTDLRVD